ncbi:MAG: hydantoinase/oxoprolinase family protein, partial [Bacteroidota bacterium]
MAIIGGPYISHRFFAGAFRNSLFLSTMERSDSNWQIWMDTGGTFTDCLAISPDGQWHRQKVLSTGCLRGQLLQRLKPQVFRFATSWSGSPGLFKDYQIRVLKQEGTAQIVQMDFSRGILETTKPLAFSQAGTFELTASEEAPILAARLITQTPLDQSLPPLEMKLGSTKGTNALLERKGADVVLFITEGFRDLLAIGTQQRPHLFQLAIPQPDLLFNAVIEVKERLAVDGTVLQALNDQEINRLVRYCRQHKIQAVAIAFLHAYRHPIHEQRLMAALLDAGIPYVSASAQLSPSIGLLPRANTAVVNAYLSPIIDQYLQGIRQHLSSLESDIVQSDALKVMTSSGGLVAAPYFRAKDSLLSGPAGGIVGAARIAGQMGHECILTLDMGGTSTDTARYDRAYDYRFTTKIGAVELLSPALAIETVAAGGGSICYFDGQKLCVGPESAGADPGPACYGAGGPLTITDVNLLLGRMDGHKLGIPIELDQAVLALQQLRDAIHQKGGEYYTYLDLLEGLVQIANEKMAEAIRRISVAKGFAPQDYALLVFGGAGGLHACAIAELLSIATVLLPFNAGILSAYGMGFAQIERLAERQVLLLLETAMPQLEHWL